MSDTAVVGDPEFRPRCFRLGRGVDVAAFECDGDGGAGRGGGRCDFPLLFGRFVVDFGFGGGLAVVDDDFCCFCCCFRFAPPPLARPPPPSALL